MKYIITVLITLGLTGCVMPNQNYMPEKKLAPYTLTLPDGVPAKFQSDIDRFNQQLAYVREYQAIKVDLSQYSKCTFSEEEMAKVNAIYNTVDDAGGVDKAKDGQSLLTKMKQTQVEQENKAAFSLKRLLGYSPSGDCIYSAEFEDVNQYVTINSQGQAGRDEYQIVQDYLHLSDGQSASLLYYADTEYSADMFSDIPQYNDEWRTDLRFQSKRGNSAIYIQYSPITYYWMGYQQNMSLTIREYNDPSESLGIERTYLDGELRTEVPVISSGIYHGLMTMYLRDGTVRTQCYRNGEKFETSNC